MSKSEQIPDSDGWVEDEDPNFLDTLKNIDAIFPKLKYHYSKDFISVKEFPNIPIDDVGRVINIWEGGAPGSKPILPKPSIPLSENNIPSSKEILEDFKKRINFSDSDIDTTTGIRRYDTDTNPPNRKNIKEVGPTGETIFPPFPTVSQDTDFINLNAQMARLFLVDKKWASLCNKIKEYQEELDKVVKKLKKQKKSCTGCALNPYRAKLIPKLLEDFKHKEIISDKEVEAIKKQLGVSNMQVGLDDNNKPHVR